MTQSLILVCFPAVVISIDDIAGVDLTLTKQPIFSENSILTSHKVNTGLHVAMCTPTSPPPLPSLPFPLPSPLSSPSPPPPCPPSNNREIFVPLASPTSPSPFRIQQPCPQPLPPAPGLAPELETTRWCPSWPQSRC